MRFVLLIFFAVFIFLLGASIPTVSANTPTPTPPIISSPTPVFTNANWVMVKSDVRPGMLVFQDNETRHKYVAETSALMKNVIAPPIEYQRFDKRLWAKGIDERAADYFFSLRKFNTDGTVTIILQKKFQVSLVGCLNAVHCFSRFYTDTTPGALIRVYDKAGKLLREVEDKNWRGGFLGDFVWNGTAWRIWSLQDTTEPNLAMTTTPTPSQPVIPTPVPVFDNANWAMVESELNPGLLLIQDDEVYRKYSNDTWSLLVGVFDPSYERFDTQFWAKDADPKAADYYFSLRQYNPDGTKTIIHPKKLQRMLIGCINVAYCASRFYTDTTPGAIFHTYDKTGKLIKQVEDTQWRGGFFADFVWNGASWRIWALYDIVDKTDAVTPTPQK